MKKKLWGISLAAALAIGLTASAAARKQQIHSRQRHLQRLLGRRWKLRTKQKHRMKKAGMKAGKAA